MASRVFLFPYRDGSVSVQALRDALGVKVILRSPDSRFRPTQRKTVINWGSSSIPGAFDICRVLNSADAVRHSVSKPAFFAHQQRVGSARLVDATSDLITALGWYDDGATVVARTGDDRSIESNHGGAGIVVLSPGDDESKYLWEQFTSGPRPNLFTKYIRRRVEFRCHFVRGREEPFLVQRKRRPHGNASADRTVRSHENGWLLTRQNVNPPDDILLQSYLAFQASGLDFGAVDALMESESRLGYVLEINSAPGLEGSSIQDYSAMFRSIIPEIPDVPEPAVGEVRPEDTGEAPTLESTPATPTLGMLAEGAAAQAQTDYDRAFLESTTGWVGPVSNTLRR